MDHKNAILRSGANQKAQEYSSIVQGKELFVNFSQMWSPKDTTAHSIKASPGKWHVDQEKDIGKMINGTNGR